MCVVNHGDGNDCLDADSPAMFYEKDLPLPANTPRSAPVDVDLSVHPGTVERIAVQFPKGCAGIVHVQIFHWERQVWPNNPSGSFRGNDTVIEFTEDYRLSDFPFVLTLRGWNDDDTYLHTPIVRVQIRPLENSGLMGWLSQLLSLPPGGGPKVVGSG